MGNVDERFLIGLIAGEDDHDHDHDQHHDYDHDDGDIMAYYSFLIYSQLTASEYSALISYPINVRIIHESYQPRSGRFQTF